MVDAASCRNPYLGVDDLWTVYSAGIKEMGLSRQHLDSFNSFVQNKLRSIIMSHKEIVPTWRTLAPKRYGVPQTEFIETPDIKLVIEDIRIGKPSVKESHGYRHEVDPLECRIRNLTYSAPILLDVVLYENGIETVRETVEIGELPIMVRSVIDPLSKMSKEELMVFGEDWEDPGGYFIINGSEKVVVIQEDLAVNRIIVGPATTSTTRITHTAKVVSTTLGIRRQVILDRMSDGSLEISMSKISYRIPFAVMMRALGLESDVQIATAVSPDPDIQRELMISLEKVSRTVTNQQQALEYIGNRLAPGQPRAVRIKRAEEFIDTQFLPHLGMRPEDRLAKAFFLAEMANRVLQLSLGKRNPDDKDHYSNKRVRLAGDLIAEVFRDAYEAFVRHLQSSLEEYATRRRKLKLSLLIRKDVITDRLKTALATGNWGQERTGVSQALDRTNWISLLSHLRRVISPLSRSQAHFEVRDLHGTHWGRLCPFETPEGINCGLVKNLALMAYISVGVDEKTVEKVLYDLGVVKLETLVQEAIDRGEAPDIMNTGAKVFLNGKPIGYHYDGRLLAEKLREMRRTGKLPVERPFEVNVSYIEEKESREVYVNTDEGRLLRPLVRLENGVPLLTKEHVEMLREGKITFWDLVKNGIIEMLDPDEEENAYVAELPCEVKEEHTHMELWVPAIMGVAASTIPYLEHNQSPRNTYQSAMAKQALGLYALNYDMRVDSHSYLLHYPQKPIVQTRALELIGYNKRPAGQNMVVALMSYEGYNMEDAIIFNKSSIDMGLARSHFLRVYVATENEYAGGYKDTIGVPPPKLLDHKGEKYYTKLAPDGIIDPETEVEGGDVLVGRWSPPRFMGESRVISMAGSAYRDTSIQLRFGEKGVVDKVIITQTQDKNKLIKVRVRDQRIPEIGDKFASRHGQKGVIGMVYPKYDLPYTEDGITPDIILNPHAIPSRMTVGQILEEIAGKVGAIYGRFIDGTPFLKEPIEDLRIELVKAGYDPNAKEIMYDGRSGRMIERPVTIGITFYQRLYHMVADKMHARATGKVQLLTRQPTEGKARQGGLRFGEMERDCLVGHGVATMIRDRMLENSDAYIMYVCGKCGHISWYNRRKGVYECPIHGETSEIYSIKVPYAFKLLLQEITSMVIKPEVKVADKIVLFRKITGTSPMPRSNGSGNGSPASNGEAGKGK